MLIIGHRGAKGYAPENTLKSFAKAIELGVDMIELDVHVVASGEVVLMHDVKIDRTTNGSGYIHEKTLDELRSLDAGGDIIPTLQEVLDFVDRRVSVNVELKGHGTADEVAAILFEYMSSRGWSNDDFIVSSFNHHELREFHRLLPNVRIAALMDAIPLDYAAFAEKLGAYSVNPGHEFVTADYVNDAHKRGLQVFVWTVDDPDELKLLYNMGVDGVFTNVPDVVHAALNEVTSAQFQLAQ